MWTSVEPSSPNRILLQPPQQSIWDEYIQPIVPYKQFYSHKSLSQSLLKCSWRFVVFLVCFFERFPALSLAVMRWCTGSLSRILSLSEKLICSLGGADGNRTHVLKVTELHRERKRPLPFNYIYNNGFGNWPRKCSLRPLTYWKSFAEKNHAAVLVLRHQELWACELLTNRHRRSCLCDFFPPQQPAHNILTSESLKGMLP